MIWKVNPWMNNDDKIPEDSREIEMIENMACQNARILVEWEAYISLPSPNKFLNRVNMVSINRSRRGLMDKAPAS